MAAKITNFDDARNKVRAMVRRELNNLKHRTQARMIKEHMSGPTSANAVSVRSGQLRRSLDGIVTTWSGDNRMQLVMFFGGGVPYARIHEYGGTITPKHARNLAIPVGVAKTKAGVAKNSGPMAMWAMLKFMVNKKTGKKLLINAAKGKKGPIEVWFVLVPSVTLPPRLHFGETFEQEATKSVETIRAIRVEGWTG